MNVLPIHPSQTNSLKEIEKTSKTSSTEFSKTILSHIDVLKIITSKTFEKKSTNLLNFVNDLDEMPQSNRKCHQLFIQTFVKDFTYDEKNYLLSLFFSEYIEKNSLAGMSLFNQEQTNQFWQSFIEYYCLEYMGFELSKDSRAQFFLNNISTLFNTNDNLECVLDQIIENFPVLLDSSPNSSKFAFYNYLALLTITLEKYLKSEVNDLSKDLIEKQALKAFDEIYFYLLHSNTSFSPIKQIELNTSIKKENLDVSKLKISIIQMLCNHLLKKDSDEFFINAEKIKTSFLDSEYLNLHISKVLKES